MDTQKAKESLKCLIEEIEKELGVDKIIKLFFDVLLETREGSPKEIHDVSAFYGLRILAVGSTPEDAAAAYCEIQELGEVEETAIIEAREGEWDIAIGTTDGNYIELGGEIVPGGVVALRNA